MKKAPSPLVSLIPIVVLVLLLFATIRTFGSDALSGGSQVSLLTTTAICILIGMVFYKIPWKDYELAITNNIAGVATAIIILLIIGALSGIWMISGVVPTLIYYGMQIIHPSFFLASTCIICALISVMTGSSWTTIATIGIALMVIRNHYPGVFHHRHSPVPSHSLYDDYYGTVSYHHADYFHSGRTFP